MISIILLSFAFSGCATQTNEPIENNVAKDNVLAWAIKTDFPTSSDVVIVNDSVFAGNSQVISASNGMIILEEYRGGDPYNPIMVGNNVFFTSQTSSLYSLDADSMQFTGTYPFGPICTNPVSVGNLVYICDELNGLSSMDSNTGQNVWNRKLTNITKAALYPANTNVLFAVNGSISLIDAYSGVDKWKTDGFPNIEGFSLYGSTILAYSDKKVFALDMSTGTVLWQRVFNAKISGLSNEFDGRIFVSTLGSGGICIDLSNGKDLWQFALTKNIQPALAIEDRIIFGCIDGKMFCFSGNGNYIWETQTIGQVKGRPTRYKNNVVFCTNNNYICSININNGSPPLAFFEHNDTNPRQLVDNGKPRAGSLKGQVATYTGDKINWLSANDDVLTKTLKLSGVSNNPYIDLGERIIFCGEDKESIDFFCLVDKEKGFLDLLSEARICYQDDSSIVFMSHQDTWSLFNRKASATILNKLTGKFETYPKKELPHTNIKSKPFKLLGNDVVLRIHAILPDYYLIEQLERIDNLNQSLGFSCFDAYLNEIFTVYPEENETLYDIEITKDVIYFSFIEQTESPTRYVGCNVLNGKTNEIRIDPSNMYHPDFIPENATSYFLQLDDKQKCEITGKRNTYNIPKSQKVNVKKNLLDLSELMEKQIILIHDPDLLYNESIKNNDKLVNYLKSLYKANIQSITPLFGYIWNRISQTKL
jgi:outer membrane protein assembly factor BamB